MSRDMLRVNKLTTPIKTARRLRLLLRPHTTVDASPWSVIYSWATRAMATNEYAKKVLVIGDAGVGKTSFVRRVTEGRFIGEYIRDTVGSEYVGVSLLFVHRFSFIVSQRNGFPCVSSANCVTKIIKREDVQVSVAVSKEMVLRA